MSQALNVSFRIRDEFNTKTAMLVYGQMDDTETLADLATLVHSLGLAVDGVTDGRIVEAHVTLPMVLTGVATAPEPGARVEQTGLLTFAVNGTTKQYSQAIPAYAADRLDITGIGPVTFFVAMLTNPAGNMSFDGCNDHGQTLNRLVSAKVSTRRYRRQLQRSSFERG